MTDSNHYQAHLIRLQWMPGRLQWRASLENVHTGELHHFGSEHELLQYLQKQLLVRPNMGAHPSESAAFHHPHSSNPDLDETNITS
ncbi:MAG: hypothetical protein KDE51_20680 [Anaerolineales bacterium]|nr:hypothetical protein [Anaerolineales bacterium]